MGSSRSADVIDVGLCLAEFVRSGAEGPSQARRTVFGLCLSHQQPHGICGALEICKRVLAFGVLFGAFPAASAPKLLHRPCRSPFWET